VHRNNILIYIQQNATSDCLFYLETALHVSGGTSTHHQERKQLYLQHLVFVTPLLLSATIVEKLEPVWVCCGWCTPPTAHSNRAGDISGLWTEPQRICSSIHGIIMRLFSVLKRPDRLLLALRCYFIFIHVHKHHSIQFSTRLFYTYIS
jgi:hypothetical protein